MDPQLVSALIIALGTIAGAIIGVFWDRSNFLDKLSSGSKFLSLVGKWDSSWRNLNDPDKIHGKEILVIERQKGSRIYGNIAAENFPDKKWEIQGNFTGQFLQLLYYPSKEADDKLFLDYGCYFFEIRGDGTFEGYSIGYDFEFDSMSIAEHKLRKIK